MKPRNFPGRKNARRIIARSPHAIDQAVAVGLRSKKLLASASPARADRHAGKLKWR